MQRIIFKLLFQLCSFVLLSINIYSQQANLLGYSWDENRKRIEISAEEEKMPKIILLTKSIIEYTFENEEFIQYTLYHLIVRVNSDDAIESSNKIYISMYNAIDVVNIKARSISKDGKIINLDKNNIKEIKNDENNHASRIFAIEGVEKGSEIE